MGLTERKLLAKINDETQKSCKEINEAHNLSLEIKVDESSFPADENVLSDFFMHKVYGLDSIAGAVAELASDSMALDAVKEQIKTIVIVNTATSFSDAGRKDVSLTDGTLSIFCAFSEGSDNLYRPDKLAKAIEGVLS